MNRFISILLLSFLGLYNAQAIAPSLTLTTSVDKPILADNGSVIGSAKLPAGTKVTLVTELSDSLLVHREGEGDSNFKIPKTSVSRAELVALENNKLVAETPTPPTRISTLRKTEEGVKNLLTNLTAQSNVQSTVKGAIQEGIDKTGAALEAAKKLTWLLNPAPTPIVPIPQAAKVETIPATSFLQTNDPLLAGYWGNACKAFLIKSLIQSPQQQTETNTFGNSGESKITARSQIDQIRIDSDLLPQEQLSRLSGAEIRNKNGVGNLTIIIQKEANHRENPGFSSTDINNLKEFLTDSNACALVEFCKTTSPTIIIKSQLLSGVLSNYDPKSESFLCRQNGPMTGSAVYRRLPATELALTGTALVITKVNWKQADQSSNNANNINASLALEQLPPKDFHYDKTLIIPGKFAFIKLPFIKQLPRGICAAAASINVLKYLDPYINLDQAELFKSFNNKPAGANDSEMIAGIKAMGFEVEYIRERELPAKAIEEKVEASLEANLPIVTFIPGHALTIIGFNKQKGTIIAWDQRENKNEGNLTSPSSLPLGAYETHLFAFNAFMFIRKNEATVSASEERLLIEIFKEVPNLQKHILPKGNDESNVLFLTHAFPQAFKKITGENRTIIMQKDYGKDLLVIKPQDFTGSTITYSLMPSAEIKQASTYEIARILAAKNGAYYSISNH